MNYDDVLPAQETQGWPFRVSAKMPQAAQMPL